MKLNELEYRGLNIWDEISPVEIALDEKLRTLHVYDILKVVEPEYDFSTKGYQLSEGFHKMAVVLEQKQFFEKKIFLSGEQWVNSITWHFYSAHRTIKTYKDMKMTITAFEDFSRLSEDELISKGFYPKYVQRL